MKILGMFAAVCAAVVALTPAPASAYRGTSIGLGAVAEASGTTTADYYGGRRYDDRRGRGWDRGRHRGWDRGRRGWRGDRRGRWRTVCRTEWRNGYRDRVCRRVRYR